MVMSPSGPRPFHRLFDEQVERALERQLAAEKRGPAAESPVFQRAHGIIKEKKQNKNGSLPGMYRSGVRERRVMIYWCQVSRTLQVKWSAF